PPGERAAVEKEMPGVRWGRRIAVLNDISPAAAFIAHNYNARVDLPTFLREAEALVAGAEKASGSLYTTAPRTARSPSLLLSDSLPSGVVNYTVWSEVMPCPQCARQVVFFDEAVDATADRMSVRDEFPCPGCGVRLTKRSLEPFFETVADPLLKRNVRQVKR